MLRKTNVCFAVQRICVPYPVCLAYFEIYFNDTCFYIMSIFVLFINLYKLLKNDISYLY